MLAIRSSQYLTADRPAVTVVLRECDLKDTLASTHRRTWVPGSLVVSQIFEIPDDGSMEAAAVVGMQLLQERQRYESNLALSYFWNAGRLKIVKSPGGILYNDRPSPISIEDYPDVLEQLAQHPNYRPGQVVIVIASDRTILMMVDGVVRPWKGEPLLPMNRPH